MPSDFSPFAIMQTRRVQLPVGDARHLAVVGLENDRGLVGLRLQVPVEAVVGRVQLAVLEPLEERRVRLVEHLA